MIYLKEAFLSFMFFLIIVEATLCQDKEKSCLFISKYDCSGSDDSVRKRCPATCYMCKGLPFLPWSNSALWILHYIDDTLCALFLFIKFQRFCPLDENDPCGPNKPSVIDVTGENASPFGEITSPITDGYGSNFGLYPHNADCQWRITVDPGKIIRLTFTKFAVENTRRYDANKINFWALLQHFHYFFENILLKRKYF